MMRSPVHEMKSKVISANILDILGLMATTERFDEDLEFSKDFFKLVAYILGP